jgi:hypothetical protein
MLTRLRLALGAGLPTYMNYGISTALSSYVLVPQKVYEKPLLYMITTFFLDFEITSANNYVKF